MREETGFAVALTIEAIDRRYELARAADPDGDRWQHLYGPSVETVPEEVYVAEVPARVDPTLAPYEHDDFRWCSFDDALELLRWESNRDALVEARAFIEASEPTRRPAP